MGESLLSVQLWQRSVISPPDMIVTGSKVCESVGIGSALESVAPPSLPPIALIPPPPPAPALTPAPTPAPRPAVPFALPPANEPSCWALPGSAAPELPPAPCESPPWLPRELCALQAGATASKNTETPRHCISPQLVPRVRLESMHLR